MSEANGLGNLTGWVIAIVGGRSLLGRRNEMLASAVLDGEMRHIGGTLSPVYDLQSGFAMTREGLARIPPMATPMLGMSIKSITLPDGAIIIPVEKLSAQDREMLAKAVQMGEEIMAQMRAAESGIIMAPPGAKLPPVRGAQ